MNDTVLMAIYAWMRSHPKASFRQFVAAVSNAMRLSKEEPPDHRLKKIPLPEVVISKGLYQGDRAVILKWEPDMPDEPGVQRCLVRLEDGIVLNLPRSIMEITASHKKTIDGAA